MENGWKNRGGLRPAPARLGNADAAPRPLAAAVLVCLLTAPAWAQKLPDLYHDETHGDPPYLSESGWRALLNGHDLGGWHAENQAPYEWFTATSVVWKRVFSPLRLTAKAAPGDRIVNGKDGKTANLITDEKFGSFDSRMDGMTDIKFTLVKEGSLPPRSDREYWDRLAEVCKRLGLDRNDGATGLAALLNGK